MKIGKIGEREFNLEIKRNLLEKEVLENRDLNEIRGLFLSEEGKDAQVSCCEYHLHDFHCVWYYNQNLAVVDRLIQEIINYKDRINQIKQI